MYLLKTSLGFKWTLLISNRPIDQLAKTFLCKEEQSHFSNRLCSAHLFLGIQELCKTYLCDPKNKNPYRWWYFKETILAFSAISFNKLSHSQSWNSMRTACFFYRNVCHCHKYPYEVFIFIKIDYLHFNKKNLKIKIYCINKVNKSIMLISKCDRDTE